MQCEIKQLDPWRWRCHLQSGLFAAGFVWRVYDPASPPAIPRVVLHPASGIEEADAAQLQDAGAHPQPARVRAAQSDRELGGQGDAGLSVQRLLCARRCLHPGEDPHRPGAAVALLRASTVCPGALRQLGTELVYRCPKPQGGGKQADLLLTPLE